MFGKKKADVPSTRTCKCPVAGCGLVCIDEVSLKRHMDWAHAAAKSSGSEPQPASREIQSR